MTTPQQAAAEVAERAGTMASMMNQRVIGVIENMAYLEVTCPDCGNIHRVDVFGSGGGENVAATLSTRLGYPVPLLGQVPLDPTLRASGDDGVPVTAGDDSLGRGAALTAIAEGLAGRGRGLRRPSAGPGPDRSLTAALRVAHGRVAGRSGVSTRATEVPLTAAAVDRRPVRAGPRPWHPPWPPSRPPPRSGRRRSSRSISFLTSATIGSTSSIRCFWMNAFGLRSRTSRSENSGPSSLLSCSCALPAIAADVLDHPSRLPGELGQLLRPEQDHRDDHQDQELRCPYVEHALTLTFTTPQGHFGGALVARRVRRSG